MKTEYFLQVIFLFESFVCVDLSVNLALNKQTTQSSTSYGGVSERAVDGNRSTNWNSGSCVHTQEGSAITEAWWQVDLGKSSEITKIKIFYRSDFTQRLNGHILKISDNSNFTNAKICYEDNIQELPSTEISHNCRYFGRYVQLSVERKPGVSYPSYDGKGAVINLCEMEVYGCEVGRYGNGNCNNACSEGCSNSSCNPNDGQCDCKVRWSGNTCSQEVSCESGMHGSNCNITCPVNCLRKECHKINGTCKQGCNNGYYGSKCLAACPKNCKLTICNTNNGDCTHDCLDGTYGYYCSQSCSKTCNGNICRKEDGKCSNGCINGHHGNTCENTCSDLCENKTCNQDNGYCNNCIKGKYAINCDKTFSTGCKDKICNRYGGICTSGCRNDNINGNDCSECKAGSYGIDCDKVCPNGCNGKICNRTTGYCEGCLLNRAGTTCEDCVYNRYGENCTEVCPINCNGNFCERKTGRCTAGCRLGFSGDLCHECKSGYYGMSCNLLCPTSCHKQICNKINGSCELGCEAGRYGTHCNLTCLQNCASISGDQLTGQCVGCSLYTYGTGCRSRCGHCFNQSTCDYKDGSCSNGCENNYGGKKCDKLLQSTDTSVNLTGPVIGTLFGTLTVVGIILSLYCIFQRRRRAKQDSPVYESAVNRSGIGDQPQIYDQLKSAQTYNNDFGHTLADVQETTRRDLDLGTGYANSNFHIESSNETNYEDITHTK